MSADIRLCNCSELNLTIALIFHSQFSITATKKEPSFLCHILLPFRYKPITYHHTSPFTFWIVPGLAFGWRSTALDTLSCSLLISAAGLLCLPCLQKRRVGRLRGVDWRGYHHSGIPVRHSEDHAPAEAFWIDRRRNIFLGVFSPFPCLYHTASVALFVGCSIGNGRLQSLHFRLFVSISGRKRRLGKLVLGIEKGRFPSKPSLAGVEMSYAYKMFCYKGIAM